jgi:hypothetical protein
MSADQNQHYLPQSYQRGWIDASGRPHVYRWAYNKLVCEPKATKSTGGRDGLYFIPMPPGRAEHDGGRILETDRSVGSRRARVAKDH